MTLAGWSFSIVDKQNGQKNEHHVLLLNSITATFFFLPLSVHFSLNKGVTLEPVTEQPCVCVCLCVNLAFSRLKTAVVPRLASDYHGQLKAAPAVVLFNTTAPEKDVDPRL